MGQSLHSNTKHGKFLKIFRMKERMETEHVLPGWGTYFHLIYEDVNF